TDGSPSSELAVQQGLELAKLTGAEVTFLHVLENPLAAGYVAAPSMAAYSAELYSDLRDSATKVLNDAVEQAKSRGVTATGLPAAAADPLRPMPAAAKGHGLVVMSTHGRRRFNRWVFGSVAEAAPRRSTVPCLLIRSEVAG